MDFDRRLKLLHAINGMWNLFARIADPRKDPREIELFMSLKDFCSELLSEDAKTDVQSADVTN